MRSSDETKASNDSFSGIKRSLPPSTPTFGDLPSPLQISASKLQFFKEVPFPQYNVDDTVSSPAAKMIKRESITPIKLQTIRTQPKSEPSESGSGSGSSNHSPSSHSSSEQGNNYFKFGSTASGNPCNSVQCYQKSSNQNIPSLFSIPKQEAPPFRPFCYNCKRYGHVKRECRSSWYHWWPQEYLFRYPWLRRKIREAGQLRWQGRWTEYRRFVKKIEEDVEEQDDKKQHLFSEYRTKPNWNGPQRYFRHGQSSAQSRADGQKILHAIRRKSPQSPPQQSPRCPTQHEFSFDCQRLIEQLQRQVDELRLALNVVKTGSVSPPAFTGNINHKSRFNFKMAYK